MVTPVSLNGAYCATAALVAIVDANSAAIKAFMETSLLIRLVDGRCVETSVRLVRRSRWCRMLAALRAARKTRCGEVQSRTFTKLPGASSSALSFPAPGTREGTSSAPCFLSQASQSGHQEPGCSLALASHSPTSASAVGFGPTQY